MEPSRRVQRNPRADFTAVLEEVVVTVEAARLRLVLHWQGGDHTGNEVAKNRYWTKSLED